jgi:hypothetical protein
MKRVWLSLLAAAILPQAAAAKDLYEGTAGTAPIVVELESGTDGLFGRTFYRRTRFNSDLTGEQHGDRLTLESRLTEDKLVLTRRGDNLAGTLTTAKGRNLPVTLHEASPPPAPPGASAELDGYARLQLAGLSLVPGATQTIERRTIRWYQEPVSKTRLFRVIAGYPPAALARINADLAETQWDHVHQWFDCPGFDGGTGVDNDEASAPYLGDGFVSYHWDSAWSCSGAAHPDFGIMGFTYDTRTGVPVRLDDLLRFGSGEPPADKSDAFYSYRSDRFAPGLIALLKRFHPDEMADKGGDDDDGCNYDDPNVWDFPAWYLTAEGLFVGAYFPRANRPCDAPDWAIIPWEALNGPALKRR